MFVEDTLLPVLFKLNKEVAMYRKGGLKEIGAASPTPPHPAAALWTVLTQVPPRCHNFELNRIVPCCSERELIARGTSTIQILLRALLLCQIKM